MPAYKDKETNTWYAYFYYTDWMGAKKRTKKRGFATKKEALEYEANYKLVSKKDMDMEFEKFVEVYFEDKKYELKERTISSKKYMVNRQVMPYFKGRKMNEIKPADIISWQQEIMKKGYSDCYNRMLNNQVNAIFNHACKIYDLQKNPCTKTKKIGKSDNKRLEFWTLKQFNDFIACIDDEKYVVLFNILFYSGLRVGELLALTKDDVDFNTNEIVVNKTYFRMGNEDVITSPKTEESNRTVNMPEFVMEMLKSYIGKIYDLGDNQRIFDMTLRAVEVKMQRTITRNNLTKIKVHSLRHSHVAYLISLGVEPLVIKERVGHTDIKMTLNTYGHLYPNEHRKVADLLDMKNRTN